jgi:hypothetical protein
LLFGTKVLFSIVLAVALSSPALAAPLHDGNVQASEYAYSYGLYFDGKNFTSGGGRLFLDLQGDDLSLGLVLPTTIVDNVYGDEAKNGRYDWPKEHKFKELKGSDKVKLKINGEKYEVEYGSGPGYDAKVKKGEDVSAHSSFGYNYDLFGSSHSDKFGDGSTSPFTTADDDYTVTEAGLGGWIFEVMYELKISDTDLGVSDLDSLSAVNSWLDDLEFHISPSKQGSFNTTVTPVPAAVWLFGSGLIGLFGYRKRFKK